jgi:hypothetical protein
LLLRIAEDKVNSSGDPGRWLGLWPGHPVLGADGGRVAHGEEVLRLGEK